MSNSIDYNKSSESKWYEDAIDIVQRVSQEFFIKGKERGAFNKAREVAINMLRLNYEDSIIADVTNLSEYNIFQIKEDLEMTTAKRLIQEGLETGTTERTIAIVKCMLYNNFDVKTISNLVDLSIDEIQSIKK